MILQQIYSRNGTPNFIRITRITFWSIYFWSDYLLSWNNDDDHNSNDHDDDIPACKLPGLLQLSGLICWPNWASIRPLRFLDSMPTELDWASVRKTHRYGTDDECCLMSVAARHDDTRWSDVLRLLDVFDLCRINTQTTLNHAHRQG